MDSLEQRIAEVQAAGNIPRHVAIIMDGNGRWAQERVLPRIAGHQEGMKSVRAVTEAAARVGLEVLTLFAFSRENWKRPPSEVRALMSLLARYAESEADELRARGIRVEAIGALEELPASARGAVQSMIEWTSGGEAMVLNLALNYSGRWDLLHAIRDLARRAAAGEVDPDQVEEEDVSRCLSTHGWPEPDLLVRTSGELRLSNFMLWQTAYTEIFVTETLWPDFRELEFLEALHEFQRRERRFGGVRAVSG